MMHKLPIVRLVTDMGSKNNNVTPNPIVWIPVGQADRDFLRSLATLGNGIMADEQDIPKLCRYYRIQEGIGKVYMCARQDRERFEDISSLEAITEGLVPNLLPEDKKGIVDAVIEKLTTQKIEKKPDDFDDIHEDINSFPPLGTRVIRGPDWKWRNQDSEGAGTIISHNTLDKWVWVKWDKGEQNVFRYGEEGAYDVLIADDHPLSPKPGEIQIGVRVMRGPDWRYGNDDGGQGCTGVVIRKKGNNLVKVRWDNGSIKPYSHGKDGIYELTVCDPSKGLLHHTIPEYLLEPEMPKFPKPGTLRRMTHDHMVWQWQDEQGQWRLYSDVNQTKINQVFRRKPEGTCLISRNGQSYRVMLRQLIERSVNGEGRHSIQQIGVSDEELKSLKKLQAFI